MTSQDALRSRIQASRRSVRRKVWGPVKIASLATDVPVLAFDQSLSHTGWVLTVLHNTGRAEVLDRGTFKMTDIVEKGHEGSLLRGVQLQTLLSHSRNDVVDDVVYETPPVRGYRIESSLLAALAVRVVYPGAVGVQRQRAISLFLPMEKRSEKKHTIEVVERFTGRADRWNEHERDAFLLAMAYLHDLEM